MPLNQAQHNQMDEDTAALVKWMSDRFQGNLKTMTMACVKVLAELIKVSTDRGRVFEACFKTVHMLVKNTPPRLFVERDKDIVNHE